LTTKIKEPMNKTEI